MYLKFSLTDQGVQVPVAVLEVGEEVQDVGAAHRAAGPLAVTSPPQRMETASLTENIYLVIIHIIVVAGWWVVCRQLPRDNETD